MHPETSSISSFKKYATKLLLPVLLIVGVVAAAFCYWFEHRIILANPSCGAYKINRILTATNKNEIPIIGSSRAETSFIPELLGSDFFNYGLEGTQENVMLFFIEQECRKKNKTSPLIIANIDLDGINTKNGDLLNYLYNSKDPKVKKLIENYHYYHAVPFMKYIGQFENYFRYYLNNRTQLNKYAKDGAFIEKTVLPKKILDELIEYRRKNQDEFKHEAELKDRFFKTLKANNDRFFVFAVPPYHSCFFTNYKNPQDAKKFLDELRALPNVRVFDFSGIIYPDSLFINTTHLNYKGALRFTKEFKDSLNTLNMINFN
jgi:hypothetical protein